MSLTLMIVIFTSFVTGVGLWFYNRRQINSLTEIVEDKNAVINSFREHLTPSEETIPTQSFEQPSTLLFNQDTEIVVDLRTEKKKKQRYGNRLKKSSMDSPKPQQQNSEKNNRPKPRRKPKTQQ